MGKLGETNLQRRSRFARETEMKGMQERMTNFAKIFDDEGVGGNDDDNNREIPNPSSRIIMRWIMR